MGLFVHPGVQAANQYIRTEEVEFSCSCQRKKRRDLLCSPRAHYERVINYKRQSLPCQAPRRNFTHFPEDVITSPYFPPTSSNDNDADPRRSRDQASLRLPFNANPVMIKRSASFKTVIARRMEVMKCMNRMMGMWRTKALAGSVSITMMPGQDKSDSWQC